MILNIKDRIYIPAILPKNGSFMDFNLKRSILQKVALTEDDKVKYSIEEIPDEDKIIWDVEKDMKNPLSIDFTNDEIDYLKKACEAITAASYPDDFWLVVEKIYDAHCL